MQGGKVPERDDVKIRSENSNSKKDSVETKERDGDGMMGAGIGQTQGCLFAVRGRRKEKKTRNLGHYVGKVAKRPQPRIPTIVRSLKQWSSSRPRRQAKDLGWERGKKVGALFLG